MFAFAPLCKISIWPVMAVLGVSATRGSRPYAYLSDVLWWNENCAGLLVRPGLPGVGIVVGEPESWSLCCFFSVGLYLLANFACADVLNVVGSI